MTIVVTGAHGTVGRYFAELASSFKRRVVLLAREELDIGDLASVRARLEAERCSVVVNLAAATDVDRCETDRVWAHRVNTLGPWNLALAAGVLQAEMVQVSTTQIFGAGGEMGPFSELDAPSPPNFYAKTKLGGEERVKSVLSRAYIVRTAWVMGGGTEDKKFVGKVAQKLARGEPIKAVNDQWGSPTYARHLVIAIRALLETGAYGLYHVTSSGMASRYDMALEMKRILGSISEIEPVSASLFPLPAPRPKSDASSSFSLPARGLGGLMPTWQAALEEYLSSWRPQ